MYVLNDREIKLRTLNRRRTNRRLTIFHKAINDHLALPIGNIQPENIVTNILSSLGQ